MTKPLALITGGARGLGLAIATALGRTGYAVMLVSRSQAELDQATAGLTAAGIDARRRVADVSQANDVTGLFAELASLPSPLEVLVNNAAVQGPIGCCAEVDPQAWLDTIAINLGGVFRCTRAALPGMIARKSGTIINVSGGGATAPRSAFSAYATAKAGVVRFTETIAMEVAASDISVFAIAPGVMDTKMLAEVRTADRAPEAERATAIKAAATGGTPLSLPAELVTFLCSRAARPLSGRLIAAAHDPWQRWRAEPASIPPTPWLTLRRLDRHTVSSLPDIA